MPVVLIMAIFAAACVAACGPTSRPAAPGQSVEDSLLVDGFALIGRSMTSGANPDSFGVSVDVQNRGATPRTVDFGDCALDARLVRSGGTADRPAYMSSARVAAIERLPDGRKVARGFECLLVLVKARVMPGGTLTAKEFRWRAPLDVVAGDSLHGVFQVVGRLSMNRKHYDVPAGVIHLP